MYRLESIFHLPECETMNMNSDTIHIHRLLYEDLAGDREGAYIPVRIRNSIINNEIVVCLGGPHFEERNVIHAPEWILNTMGYTTDSPCMIDIEPYDEPIPNATIIHLKPLDESIFHDGDIRICLEHALDGFSVLQQGITFMAQPNSGSHSRGEIYVYVEKTEPSGVVRLGGEVAVEFVNDTQNYSHVPDNHTEYPQIVVDPPLVPSIQSSTPDERREQVRQSWIKRFNGQL